MADEAQVISRNARRGLGRAAWRAGWMVCAALLVSCGHGGDAESGALRPAQLVTEAHPGSLRAAPLATEAHSGAHSAGASLSAVTLSPIDIPADSAAPLTGTFVSPAGRTLQLASFEHDGRRVVRFTATEPGTWHYALHTADRTVREGTIAASPARSTHGFVHTRGHAFLYDDGTPFIALGENRINIYDPRWNWHSLGIADYIRYMSENGMTVLRVFIVSDVEDEEHGGTNPGVIEPTLGHFDDTVASQFDTIFHTAEARGVYVVLVAFALGFSPDDAWKSWQDNPYSKERGGPAATRLDFFGSPAVRARAAERIRYLAARYAASPSLLAIDLLNEPEWDGAIPETVWEPWAEEMARVWRTADPYGHAVTVGSVGLHWNIEGDERAWWSSRECDVVQWHLYGKEIYEVHALAAEMTRKIRETWNEDKPVLVGEFAYGGEPKPAYDHTHVGLWSALFSGAGVLAHSAPPFNLDSDELMTPERAHHFRVLRDFLHGLPVLQPGKAEATADVSAWALVGKDAAALWLLAPKRGYGRPVHGVRVSVRGLPDGAWHVHWVNDVTGAAVREAVAQSSGGTLQLTAPPFTEHVAARLSAGARLQ